MKARWKRWRAWRWLLARRREGYCACSRGERSYFGCPCERGSRLLREQAGRRAQ